MSFNTDHLRLNDQNLFKEIRESLPKGIIKTQNLLTVKEDVLFVWDHQNLCVLTLNLKTLATREGEHVKHQKLLPTCTPIFTPELLISNTHCELLAVAGPLGILVLELPRRGTPNGTFAGGKEIVYCRTHPLDERLLAFNKLVEVRQVRWHPASKKDCHLLVLTSDNMFRLYIIQNSTAALLKVYPFGPQPTSCLPGTRLPFLASLGETGVDFDFGPPTIPDNAPKEIDWNDLMWPIFILRGDGEIFSLVIDITQKNDPILKGPYSMYPHSEDNYGIDPCSIICFRSTPPVVAISRCNGTIYHCILLPPNEDTKFQKKGITKHSNYTLHPADQVLYVFECIELELGISANDSDVAYSCPIFLLKDESCTGRYFCSHETGIHTVYVPTIKELDTILDTDEDDVDKYLPNLNKVGTAEYILCTKAIGTSNVNPVLGFSIFYSPTTVIALLATGQVVSLPLFSVLLDTESFGTNSDANKNSLNTMTHELFDVYIRGLLKSDMNQPILKLSDGNTSVAKSYELLMRALAVFRQERFQKLDTVRKEIDKKVNYLQTAKKTQMAEIERINEVKQSLQENAEALAEKYEDIKDKQEELAKRCERILVTITHKQPHPTEAEKNFYRELNVAKKKMEEFRKEIDYVKSKHKYQELQMKNWNSQENKKEIHFNSVQTDAIKSNLELMTKQIATMITDIKALKQDMGLK